MGGTRIAAVIGALAATAALINVASAGTDPVQRTHKLDRAARSAGPTRSAVPTMPGVHKLSTRKAVHRYLRSVGISPRHVVIQRGKRNYAGTRCPGKRWNCTTATRVFQISSGTNTVECTPSTGGSSTNTTTSQTCVIMQTGGGANTARCTEKSSQPAMKQECTITQAGTDNNAYVTQLIDTSATSGTSPLIQDSSQEATVTQQGGDNFVDGSQDIKLSIDGQNTDQNGHQSFIVCQGGSTCAVTTPTSGTNDSKIQQSTMETANGSTGAIQNQNTAGLTTPFFTLTDCDPGTPVEPDSCAHVEQYSTTRNDNDLHQDNHLLEQAGKTGSSTQTQGNGNGGLEGGVTQLGGGTPSNNVHEHLKWDQSEAGTQDPGANCCSTDDGAGGTGQNLHQVFDLHQGKPGGFQRLDLIADCESLSRCNDLQSGKINGAQIHTHCEENSDGSTPAACFSFVTCESASFYTPADCFEADPGVGSLSISTSPLDATALTAMGFDTSDFQDVFNFQFPVTLGTGGL
jgi:hypothetical protein